MIIKSFKMAMPYQITLSFLTFFIFKQLFPPNFTKNFSDQHQVNGQLQQVNWQCLRFVIMEYWNVLIIDKFLFRRRNQSMNAKLAKIIESDKRLNQLYHIKKQLGRGCFGMVYECVEKASGRESVLKIEAATADQKNLTLEKEYRLMKLLQHIDGIPKVYNFCKYHRFNFIELQRLDRDLEHLLLDNKNLTPEEICDIGCQIIEVMKGVHGSHVIHRDIKPQNIMFDSNMKAYLIDFGISTLLNSKALKTKKIYKKIGFFIGTPRYASLSAHLGQEIMAKDDIESLLYVLIYATSKKLPWVNVKTAKNKVEEIGKIKQKYPKKDLCKFLPRCYLSIFTYLETLTKDDPVDYARITDYFKQQRMANTLHTMKTLPTDLSTGGKEQSRRQSKKYSLKVPDQSFYIDDCILTDRVIVEFMTRYVFEQDNDDSMSVEEQLKTGELSLANKLSVLTPVNPKLKLKIDDKPPRQERELRKVSWLIE